MKPRLVELINFKAPAGFQASVEAAARCRGVTTSEFIRRAIAQSVASNTDAERCQRREICSARPKSWSAGCRLKEN